MSRVALVLAYDGTDFAGWQRQQGLRTVQGEVEAALRRLVGEAASVHGASRTDAGVHALAQVAHADLDGMGGRTPRWLADRLNAILPADVRVKRVASVDASFHARKSAVGKAYRYDLHAAPTASPFLRRYRYHVRWRLDVEAMAAAAGLFVGRRDFASLRTAGSSVKTSVRDVTACSVRRRGPRITVDVEGSGFLRHMVRALVGSLLEVGRGRRRPEWVLDMLDECDRGAGGPNVPPHGLFLTGVRYEALSVLPSASRGAITAKRSAPA